jgi:hypothetical protein
MVTLSELIHRESYYENMNKLDLASRSYKNNQDAFTDFLKNIRKPSIEEQLVIQLAIKYANSFTQNFSKFKKIEWKIMITENSVEAELPHTHADIIFLPSSHVKKVSASLINTLIHEKIHVFQRLHPCECNMLYTKYWGFSFNSINYGENSMTRSNPDINQIIYNDDNNHAIIAMYKSLDSPRLSDITDTRDHPHEMMAYLISCIITQKEAPAGMTKYVQSTKDWMLTYF